MKNEQKCNLKGGRFVSGKCMGVKSYNPFKMWGSWIGALIGLLAAIPSITCYSYGCFAAAIFVLPALPLIQLLVLLRIPFPLYLIIGSILTGFIIGFGANYVFRRLRK